MPRGRGQRRRKGANRGRGRGAASPMPIDSRASREAAELGNEASDTRVGLAAKYDRAQRKIGFGAGEGDPYTLKADNSQNLDSANRGIGTTAGNSLYSGATLNARSAARSNYDRNQKSIEESQAEAESDYATGNARTTRDEQTLGAGIKEGSIERRIATEPAPLAAGEKRRGRGRPGQPPQPTKPKKGRGR